MNGYLSGAVVVASMLNVVPAMATTVHVRVVDPTWDALPSVVVHLSAVQDCARKSAQAVSQRQSRTAVEGTATFDAVSPGYYLIAVGSDGGFEARAECVDLTHPGPSGKAYVQVRLRPDPRRAFVLSDPAAVPDKSPELTVGDLLGAYVVDAGEILQVRLMADGAGLEVELPDLRVLYFPSRSRWEFAGQDGTLVFQITNGRVVGLSLTPRKLTAKKGR